MLAGREVAVDDGDAVTVVDRNHARHTIRMAGVDAPERNQPSGTQPRGHLIGLAFGKDAVVKFHKEDRYGRQVGKVLVIRDVERVRRFTKKRNSPDKIRGYVQGCKVLIAISQNHTELAFIHSFKARSKNWIIDTEARDGPAYWRAKLSTATT